MENNDFCKKTSDFINFLFLYKMVDDVIFFKYDENMIDKIKNSPHYSDDCVLDVESNMPYSFGIEMFFKDDIGYYSFNRMLNEIVDDYDDLDTTIDSQLYILPIEKSPDFINFLGEEHFDEITELINKDLHVVLTIVIYKPSSFIDTVEDDIQQHNENILADLQNQLEEAKNEENYELCSILQELIDEKQKNLLK